MPARGGLPDLSDEELRGAIVYMFNYGVPIVAAPATPPPPADPHHKVVSGTDIYFGLMRAEAMHDAQAQKIPAGKGYYHLNISLADAKSQVQVTDADMERFHKALDCYVTYADVIAQTTIHQVFDKEVHFELFREDQKPPFDDLFDGLRSAV